MLSLKFAWPIIPMLPMLGLVVTKEKAIAKLNKNVIPKITFHFFIQTTPFPFLNPYRVIIRIFVASNHGCVDGRGIVQAYLRYIGTNANKAKPVKNTAEHESIAALKTSKLSFRGGKAAAKMISRNGRKKVK